MKRKLAKFRKRGDERGKDEGSPGTNADSELARSTGRQPEIQRCISTEPEIRYVFAAKVRRDVAKAFHTEQAQVLTIKEDDFRRQTRMFE